MAIALQASMCEDKNEHFELIFTNNSNKDIRIADSYLYPDTSLCCRLSYPLVRANSIFIYKNERTSWEKMINNGLIQFFVIDAEVFENNECDSIRKNNLILKRYALTRHDLKTMNWTITYP